MGRKIVYFCDICEMDGDEEVVAVAKYEAADESVYAVCEKHLEQVKLSKLEHWPV